MNVKINNQMHSFFSEINKYPDLKVFCRTDAELQELPEAYSVKSDVKAIILGADPTNNGIRGNTGIKKLKYVFGINEPAYEKWFFRPQKDNLFALNPKLTKDDFYIQNLCRNYFVFQTYKNKTKWSKIAIKFWVEYLKDEIKNIPRDIPILSTSDVITFVLVPKAKETKTADIYSGKIEPNFFSTELQRYVLPFYRGFSYPLNSGRFPKYLNLLKQQLHV